MMNIFKRFYQTVLKWSAHRFAGYYLAIISFTEAIIFPIPPDVMLIPMCLAKPKFAWRYATIATLASVSGGVVGYCLGVYFFQFVQSYLIEFNYIDDFHRVEAWFQSWGIWAISIASFTPIPYKIFTISAGLMHMALAPFVIASALGRALRFYLVAAAMFWGGDRLRDVLQKYIEYIGWFVVFIFLLMLLLVGCSSG